MEPQPTRTVTIGIGGRAYEMSSDDDYLDRVGADFEPTTVALLQTLVAQGDTVFDVGANIGCTTLLFAQRAQSVYSFEPSQHTFGFLAQNVKTARQENVVLENVALGNDEKVARLVSASSDRSSGFISASSDPSGGFISAFGLPDNHHAEDISMKRGDTVVQQRDIAHVDFIKIDTEGHEREVLEGLRNTIERDRPVVCLELNHWCLNVFRRVSVPDFLDYLRSVFPLLYAVDHNEVRDLHDEAEAHVVMHEHIVGNRFQDVVGAFDVNRLDTFLDRFVRKSEGFRELEDRCWALEGELTQMTRAMEDMQEALGGAEAALAGAEAELAGAEAELADTKRTVSWRITKPLRAVRRRMVSWTGS